MEHAEQVARAVPPALPPRPPPRPRPTGAGGPCGGGGGSGGGGGGGPGAGGGGGGAGPGCPGDAITIAPAPGGSSAAAAHAAHAAHAAAAAAAAMDGLEELSPAPPVGAAAGPGVLAGAALAAHAAHLAARKPPVLRRACWLRKYVFLCTACGGLAVLLGALFLTVYFMLRSYTSSLAYFETVPTYVPAAMLIGTGLVVMCLAGRRNRYAYLIKLCGGCCLACAVLCVVVTITTTVVHMNRLQTLRECIYTQKTQTCTCYSALHEPAAPDRTDEGVRYVFNATPDCEVVHGALYSCLRAMFGLSVIGILICIFSCMLVYQLLSHEKKKMYWEQLEMRCRYLYRQQRAAPPAHHCACCEECRFPPPAPPELFPWEAMDDRYWSGPGRVGNLYSPNPGEEAAATQATAGCGGGSGGASAGAGTPHRASSGWSWRRLPWSRGGGSGGGGGGSGAAAASAATAGVATGDSGGGGGQAGAFRNATGSPDSQYGFSSRPALAGAARVPEPTDAPAHPLYGARDARVPPGSQSHSVTQQGQQSQPSQRTSAFMTESSMAAIHIEGYPPPAGAVPVVAGGQPTNQQRYYMWGPPPPYSNPNSPARSAANNPPPPAPGGAQPLLSLLAPGSGAATGAASQGSGVTPTGAVSPRYHHFQHHHHLHHHHHHCQLQAQQQQQQQQLQTQGAQTLTQGEVLVGGTGLLKHLQQQRNRTCPQGGLRRFPEGSGHCFEDVSSSSGDVASSDCKNTSTSVENYMNASEAELASADISETNTDSSGSKDRASNTLPARKAKKRLDISSVKSVANIPYSLGPGAPAAYPSAGNLQGMFSPGQRDSKMSIEEEFHHNGEDSNGNPAGSHSHYMSGITNTAFQDQEGQASSKSDQTESEVYFADVSSCCNVSVRNDGQDSSLYDEAVDPQKRLMILNRDGRNRVTGIPPGGQFPAHHHDHHSHHHPLLGTENSMMNCVGNEDAQVSGGCFSYPRQGSCNRMPYALVRHPMETVEDRMCGQVCSRDYLGQVTKDPSVSSGNGTPLTETASPMSVSTSSPSPGSYPPEGIVNCVTFYREGTVLVGEKDSTNMCSGTDMYPPVHKPSQGQTQQRNVEYSDNHFLAPDAQYETISSQPQQYPCHLQKVFAGREDFNGNTPPNSPGRGKVMTSSPSRRHLNLPLHITTTGGTTNNSNIIENLYHTATSTEEEELDHQQQYSDATMDSGCHSGSEFAARHLRAPASGTPGSTGAKMSDEEEEQQSTGSNVQVTNMRSVNV